jgi:hypothetical protein
MQQSEILVIGSHPEILKTIIRLINNNPEWNGTGVLTVYDAIKEFKNKQFDLVLVGAGVDEEKEKQLRALFTGLHPGVHIVRHYGGGSGLLKAEIQGMLDSRR